MHNDSIETLLARHYGSTAVAPTGLEEHLNGSVRQHALEMQQEQRVIAQWRTNVMSRRRAVQLVALGSVGLSIVNLGLEGLQTLEASMMGQETTQNAVLP